LIGTIVACSTCAGARGEIAELEDVRAGGGFLTGLFGDERGGKPS